MNHQRFTPRRRTALFSLAVAAAISAGSITLLSPRAEAVSASASEASYEPVASSPRELVSMPARPTIRTVESPRRTLPPESTTEETAQNRRNRRPRRGGNRTVERRTTTTTTRRTADTSKEEVEDKKQVVIPPAPMPLQFSISAGWQSRYIFHGLDIISFNSRYRVDGNTFAVRDESSSIWFTDATVAWKGLRLGVGYIQAVDPTVPYFQNSALGRVISFGPRDTADHVSLYREVDVHLDYTHALVPNWLDGTIGYNSYIFPNKDFKGTNYQGEIPIRLTFTRIPFVRPSFTYYRYISDYKRFEAGNLNGNYVEFRLDTGFPLYTSNHVSVAIAPYALVSYNINYLKFSGNDDIGGWNTFETGIKLPIRVGRHFTVTPFGNYGANLSDATLVPNNFAASSATGTDGHRSFGEHTSFWGGVNLSYSF
ncbi:MAG: hypothetical protein JO295_10615 [Verrucomicrobia bacterium]|nr:hypothetical protein [Verrucomicrobiota bacterium]